MTTTYKTVNYATSEALHEAIKAELEALAYPYTVKHKTYGEGQLVFVKVPSTGQTLYATVDFAVGSKMLSLDVVLTNNLLEMPEILMEILLEAQTTYKVDAIEREHEALAARLEADAQARVAAKQAKADKEAEEKYERTKAKAIQDFEALTVASRPVAVANDFYYSLGWLAKHVGSVSAKLPDYLADSFKKHFGSDVAFNAVDSKKKTVNGHAMQWTFGFVATLRKPENIPAGLTEHLGSTGNKIADTSFIWDLVDNYGFQFGKTQDLDKIRSHVPSEYLASFEAGLA